MTRLWGIKTTTVAGIVMTTASMHVTVGAFDTRQKHMGPKVATIMKMRLSDIKNDDSYEDGDLKRLHPCDS